MIYIKKKRIPRKTTLSPFLKGDKRFPLLKKGGEESFSLLAEMLDTVMRMSYN